MRCPGCGIELNHTALKRKKCGTCGFILPVISVQKSDVTETPVVSAGGLKLPPPKRKPVTIGSESLPEDDYREGVVHTSDIPDEPFISEEPSITTEEPEFPLKSHPAPESISFTRKPRRIREESEKTIKVEMLPPPAPPSAGSDIWKDRALIFFIIISTLSITILVYLFIK